MTNDKLVIHITNIGESEFPAMGAFAVGTATEGQPLIRFNLEALIQHSVDETPAERLDIVKEGLLELWTHEIAHALQEYLNMELSEEMVDKVMARYKEEWKARADNPIPEEHRPMVDAQSALEMVQAIRKWNTIEEVHSYIDTILPELTSWAYTGS